MTVEEHIQSVCSLLAASKYANSGNFFLTVENKEFIMRPATSKIDKTKIVSFVTSRDLSQGLPSLKWSWIVNKIRLLIEKGLL